MAATFPLRGVLIGALGAALVALSAGAASAQSAVWTGATSSDWADASNWSGGIAPVAGQPVNIGTPAIPAQSPAVIGVTGPVSVSVGVIGVGQGGTVPGLLTIQNGSTLTNTVQARLGINPGSIGIVTVTGPGSQWTSLDHLESAFKAPVRSILGMEGKSTGRPRSWGSSSALLARSTLPVAARCRL
ncbi:hypothetical protein [Rhizobium laguerreae]|uniref:hypothetical protein n=1 Tax=Rhizobium laguerreae TaxID=1076926 RepID=UPI001FE757E3|nr:hypothetical protein [Rhizobium laguerreae]